MHSQLLFLPGALGRTELWLPVADRLAHPAPKIHIGWPGFGSTPPDPEVKGIDDLVAKVVSQINQPTALIAQSMGGVVAIRAALEKPDLVTHLVLSVTSGGIDMRKHGAQDWRASFLAAHPSLPRWFSAYQEDLTTKLPELHIPTLLLWGDADPISPVGAGERLASLLPRAKLHILPGGEHDLASTFAADVAPLIDAHLGEET
ncbi:alpha/beta fold hydrolase [Noviherbaspirillum denitrificans]|uniref:Alpha/beta hydrolase n=1 Tax=Noviherbaspirillum denitrificans TaxID=1968433 RepID=A0A254T5T2_9BURK|nr:alpha/beta hydrolase [Noviherbaspirillum denitrificans]OWW18059.1 alpha/beta hydrolase [Noviherbaspirillum denitrificans]